MLIPSGYTTHTVMYASLSRRVNANSQRTRMKPSETFKLIKKGEC